MSRRPDVPEALLRAWNPAEALAEPSPTDWAARLREANRASLTMTEAEREEIRRYGLVSRRGPANLGEHHLGDQLGREVLSELARKR